jgi:thiamine kinase-like enzyme
MQKVKNIIQHFDLPGRFVSATVNITGLINDTYIIICREKDNVRYILQRINIQVFTKPVEVMENIEHILHHQAIKIDRDPDHPDPARGVLKLMKTVKGENYHIDENGDYWRIYPFIENSKVFNIADTEDRAFEAAKAFGRFGRYLSDLDVSLMHYTIPNFHNIEMRYSNLKQAMERDVAGRIKECRDEIAFALNHEHLTEPISRLLKTGELPLRVTHNDTKINNVLMDEESEKGLCVIDLDTVMPGSVLSDFGDMVRTFTNTVKEDDPHIRDVEMRMHIFRALVEGYLEETSTFLQPIELENLVYGGKLITLMQGIRNLTDYLMGDVYYKTDYEEHNLHRTQNQFALLNSIEQNEKEMSSMISNLT